MLDIFYGQLSPEQARIYARSRTAAGDASVRLLGSIEGPYCAYSRTLPARVPFRDRGGDPYPLAEAIVPDPCYWSARLPFLYRVHVELEQHGQTVAIHEQLLGLRQLGSVGTRLVLEGEPWTLRAIETATDPLAQLADLHDTDTGLILNRLHDTLLREASHTGVWIVGWPLLESEPAEAVIRQWSRYPAVSLLVLESRTPLPDGLREVAPNLLLAEYVPPGEQPSGADWARVVVCDSEGAEQVAAKSERPVLVVNSGRGRLAADNAGGGEVTAEWVRMIKSWQA